MDKLINFGVSIAIGVPVAIALWNNYFNAEYIKRKEAKKKIEKFMVKKFSEKDYHYDKKDIRLNETGLSFRVEIADITSFDEFLKQKDYINTMFGANGTEITYEKGFASVVVSY